MRGDGPGRWEGRAREECHIPLDAGMDGQRRDVIGRTGEGPSDWPVRLDAHDSQVRTAGVYWRGVTPGTGRGARGR